MLMRISSGTSAGSRRLQPSSSSIQRQSYATSTESSRIRSTDPIPYSPSMHPSLSFGNSWGRACPGCASTSDCSAKSFQLPLYKVAAFIRTAKLLPRLLDKYIAQLQLKGQEQRVTAGGRKVDGLPVMPCLQLQLQQSVTVGMPVTSQTGQRRRSVWMSVFLKDKRIVSIRHGTMRDMFPVCKACRGWQQGCKQWNTDQATVTSGLAKADQRTATTMLTACTHVCPLCSAMQGPRSTAAAARAAG
jgi:hypothetical protein